MKCPVCGKRITGQHGNHKNADHIILREGGTVSVVCPEKFDEVIGKSRGTTRSTERKDEENKLEQTSG